MPWNPAQERLFHAVAHGWKPSDPKLQHLTQGKAQSLLAEAGDVKAEAQKKALRSMGTKGQTS